MNLVSRHSQQLDVKIFLPLFFYSHLVSSEHQQNLQRVFSTSAWGDFARTTTQMRAINSLSLPHIQHASISDRSLEMIVSGF